MAGRGRGLTLPAWMTKENPSLQATLQSNTGSYQSSEQIQRPEAPASYFSGGDRESDKHTMQREGFGGPGSYDLDQNNSISDRGRGGPPDRDRRDSREPRDRERERGGREIGGRSRDRGMRERDRGGSRERRKDRSRDRGDRDRRAGGRGDRDRRDSRSRDRSRERRRKRKSNFDVKPPGFEGLPTGDAATNLLAAQAFLQQQQQAAAAAQPPPPPGMNFMGMMGGGGLNNANLQQTRHARRLYVGGVQNVTEEELKVFFNHIIDLALGEPTEGGPVLSVYINLERAFAFVELKSIELTTACMALDGLRFRDLQLKIRRPSDYNPALLAPSNEPIPSLNLHALGVVSTNVPDGPNKIFVGGLPYHLQEEQVRELLQAFGALKAFHLVREPGSNTSKGYGFCEYVDQSVTQKACEGLNGMTLGDKTLTVKMATNQRTMGEIQGMPGLNMMMTPQSIGLTVQEQLAQAMSGSFAVSPNLAAQTAQTAAQGALAAAMKPTKVLVLMNMIGEDDLTDDNEYEDILEDIRDECGKYGQVVQVVIPRPGSTYSTSAVGKCYIQYTAEHMSQTAAVALAGRQFGTRVVKIEYFAEDKFAMGLLE